jgi:hypothetical protein
VRLRDGRVFVLYRSDDVRVVNCPECRATGAYWEEMVALARVCKTPLDDADAARARAAGVNPDITQDAAAAVVR